MSKNRKVGLIIAIGAFTTAVLLQSLFLWDYKRVQHRLAKIEQALANPDSTRFSVNRDTLYFFSSDMIFALPLPKN